MRRVAPAVLSLILVAGGAVACRTVVPASTPAGEREREAPAGTAPEAREESQVKLGEKQRDPEEQRKDAIARAREHLSKTAGVKPEEIELESATPSTWPDTSLGCPEKDRMYAQVVTEGHTVVLRAGGKTHELHLSRSRVVSCKSKVER